MKRKLLLAALCVVSALGMRAQTDVTSTYLTNADFETDGLVAEKNTKTGLLTTGWNITNLDYGRMAIFDKDQTPGVNTYGSSDASHGTYYLLVRSNLDKGKQQCLEQVSSMSLPKGKYTVMYDYKAARTLNTSKTFIIRAKNDASEVLGLESIDVTKVSANTSYFGEHDWTTASFDFTLSENTNVKLDMQINTQQVTVVLLDNFKLYYSNINGNILAALIAQATSINTAKGGLNSAIATAQDVYDGINDTPDYQDDIDDAISTLKSAITSAVAGITMHHNDDLSYLIANAGFEGITAETGNYSTAEGKDYSMDGWVLDTTCDSGQGAVMTYGSGYTVNAAAVPASDNAGNSGKALGLSAGWGGTQLYKTAPITLPAGKYKLQIYGYNAGTSTKLTSKFGFGSNLSTKTTYTESTWEEEEVTFTLAEATEGCFQFGGVAVSGSGSGSTAKVFFDNITLTYLDELGYAQDLWQEAHDALAAKLVADELPDAAEDSISTELAKSVPDNVDDVNEATAALQALVTYYDNIKASYDKAKDFIEDVTSEKDNSTGTKTTITSAIDKAADDIEKCKEEDELETVYSTLDIARKAYLTSGAQPKEGESFDLTFKITNPSFENGTTGWTVPNKGSDSGTKNTGIPSNMSGYYFNNWANSWSDLNVQQTISDLPNGQYTVSAVLASYNGTQTYLEASGNGKNVSMTGEDKGVPASVTTNITSGTLLIRARAGRTSSQSLLKVDNFTMVYQGLRPSLKSLIESATTKTTTNVGSGVFQIPASAATTLSSAISTAQVVYDDDDAMATDIQTAIDDLNDAIDAFEATALKAPDEEDVYSLYLSDGGTYAKTVTFKDGNATEGTYAIGFTEDAGSAFNQAIHFKSTATTNQYKLYIEDASGTKYYICTSNGGGYEGSTEQLRMTTTEEDALAILLVASGTENGVYYLKNTASSNALIGTSDGGFYTTTKYNKFNINPATKASVPVAISSGKWGTRIFPFEVTTIPDGLEVYTVDDVDGTAIVKSDALASIPANTPVVLKATKDVNVILEGYGVAKNNSYSPDGNLLTGVYTAASIAASVEPTASEDGVYRYVLQTQEDVQAFYKVDAAFTATPYRCYLSVTQDKTPAEAKAFFFDETTDIDEVEIAEDGDDDAPTVNLAGQNVGKDYKGIVIKAGKKYLQR